MSLKNTYGIVSDYDSGNIIKFWLKTSIEGNVSDCLIDIGGRQLTTNVLLIDQGENKVIEINKKAINPGIYFISIQIGEVVFSDKVIIR